MWKRIGEWKDEVRVENRQISTEEREEEISL
jgi:hypothetical protein